MAELADAQDSKPCGLTPMRVRFSPAAHTTMNIQKNFAFYLTVVIFPLIIIALITLILVVKPAPKDAPEIPVETASTTIR